MKKDALILELKSMNLNKTEINKLLKGEVVECLKIDKIDTFEYRINFLSPEECFEK